MTRFYRHWGLTIHHAQSWTARGLAGLSGDGTDAGTTIRIHKPLPVGRGRIGVVNYVRLMRALPAATYQVCHR